MCKVNTMNNDKEHHHGIFLGLILAHWNFGGFK